MRNRRCGEIANGGTIDKWNSRGIVLIGSFEYAQLERGWKYTNSYVQSWEVLEDNMGILSRATSDIW